MEILREITRVDFVKQDDGSTTFCVEVVEIAPDPFDKSKTIRRKADPAPMTPEMAKERFGYSLDDIVKGINEAVVADNNAKSLRISDLENEGDAQATKIFELEAQLTKKENDDG